MLSFPHELFSHMWYKKNQHEVKNTVTFWKYKAYSKIGAARIPRNASLSVAIHNTQHLRVWWLVCSDIPLTMLVKSYYRPPVRLDNLIIPRWFVLLTQRFCLKTCAPLNEAPEYTEKQKRIVVVLWCSDYSFYHTRGIGICDIWLISVWSFLPQ